MVVRIDESSNSQSSLCLAKIAVQVANRDESRNSIVLTLTRGFRVSGQSWSWGCTRFTKNSIQPIELSLLRELLTPADLVFPPLGITSSSLALCNEQLPGYAFVAPKDRHFRKDWMINRENSQETLNPTQLGVVAVAFGVARPLPTK